MSCKENIKLTLAYDGRIFFGWQQSKEGPTVEKTLRRTIEQLLQHPVTLQAASRTDRGVHADGQVVNFFTKKKSLCIGDFTYRLNALLPKEIRVLQGKKMPISFHPTLDATGKQYNYFVCNSPLQLPKHMANSWHIPKPLNLKSIERASHFLVGSHDFSAFCNAEGRPKKGSAVRTLTKISFVSLPHKRLRLTLRGDAFLYKMVRTIVGTLIDVGLNKHGPDKLPLILQSKKRELAGATAPAHALFLAKIFY